MDAKQLYGLFFVDDERIQIIEPRLNGIGPDGIFDLFM